MNTNKPFSRSLALIAAIHSVVAATAPGMLRQQMIPELAQRKEFQSRGHGRSKRSGVNVKALNKMRRHGYAGHYAPYSGKQEAARRAGDIPRMFNQPRWFARDMFGSYFVKAFKTRKEALALLKFENCRGVAVLH